MLILSTSIKNIICLQVTWDYLNGLILQGSILGSLMLADFFSNLNDVRLAFSRISDLRRNFEIAKEKPTRKACFSHEKKHLAPRIHQVKFCLASFLWSQRNLYYIFTRNRCWNEGEHIWKGLIAKVLWKAW